MTGLLRNIMTIFAQKSVEISLVGLQVNYITILIQTGALELLIRSFSKKK